MSGRPWSSPFPWRSGSSGPSASSGAARRRTLSFLLRFAAAYGVVYLAWLPLQAPFVALLAASASRVLWLLDRPRLIVGLASKGSDVLLKSYLSGRVEPIASWGAENIHIFVVASLALVLAVPAGGWMRLLRRTAGASLAIFAYALALTLVQIRTVAERVAAGTFGMTLTTHAEKVFLNWANRGLIMVGMLALPAFLFLLAYVSSWSSGRPPEPPLRAEKPATIPPPRRKGGRVALSLALAATLVAAMAAVRPSPPAPLEILSGLRRVVALNPSSPQAHFSLALQLEDQGKLPEAQAAYEAALRLDPGLVAAWFNLGNVSFKQGHYGEAERCYDETLSRNARHAPARNNLGNALFKQERYSEAAEAYHAALEIDETHASTHKNLGEALLHLGDPCQALEQFRRSAALDRSLAQDPGLSARMARLGDQCGQ